MSVKPKILIVEDEPAIADTISYALDTEGFETLCSAVGEPVPSLLDKEQIDLIILDIGLPDINGLELCKEIRKTHNTPIIFLTARSDEIDRVVGLEIGGDDYVTKPFSPRELTARVKAVLRRMSDMPSGEAPSAPAASSASDAFLVNETKRQMTYQGRLLDLSRYEYRLLRVFVQRPGRVFTREELMERAWDEPEASMDRTVDAHIKNLRAKLRAVTPDVDPIITHRGVGYAMKENL